MSKTTSLLKHMTEETHLYRNEHYSSMTVVAMGQNLPHHSMEILVSFENGGTRIHLCLLCNVLNNANLLVVRFTDILACRDISEL